MDPQIFITGVGRCKEIPPALETIKPVKTVIRAEEMALAAVSMALKQVGWNPTFIPPFVKGGVGGLGIIFGIDDAIDNCKSEFFKGILHDGAIGASPLLFPYTSPNAITAQASIAFGIKGESITIASGPLSFLKAMGYGFELLNARLIQSVVVGGISENGAMVIVMESLAPDKAQKKREEGVRLKEVVGYNNALLQACPRRLEAGDEANVKSIEDSFRMVEDFLHGKDKLVTADWMLQTK